MVSQVLVVDDDRTVRASLLRLLRARGYVAVAAHTGAEAIEIAQRIQPQVILIDIVMTDDDGLEIARALKSDPMLATIPLIALTASPDRARDYASLFRSVLTKPCPSAALFRAIEQTLSSSPPRQ